MNQLADLLSKTLGPSWRTSLGGWAAIPLGLLVIVVLWGIGYDWVPVAGMIIPIIVIALSQLTARDNKVSDQQAGIRPELVTQPGPDNPKKGDSP